MSATVVPFKREPDPGVIEGCKSLLRDAESGKMVVLVAVGVTDEGDAIEFYANDGKHRVLLAGAAACLERRIQDRMREVEGE